MKGLEPPRLSAPDPKSGAATNYATSASGCKDTTFCIGFNNAVKNRSAAPGDKSANPSECD